MSIFNFEKNNVSLSGDWELFQKFMGNIGAFTYIAKEKTAYMDAMSCKILNCSHEKINEYEFFNLLDKISKKPVEGQKHIYSYSTDSKTYFIKMNIFENSDVWLGFVQDYTRQIYDSRRERSASDCDQLTRLLSYSSFTYRVREMLPAAKTCCLATIHLNNIDKLGTFLTVENTNHCITSVAEAINQFASDRIIIGAKSHHEICILFVDYERMSVNNLLNSMDEAVQGCIPADDFGEIIDISDKTTLSLSIGCCSFPDQAYEFNMLVNYSEFALYEARSYKRSVVNWFNEDNYISEKDAYRNAQIFNKIIHKNLLTYHVQPVVDAKTGSIIAYEAFMRTTGDISMPPLQLLKIAAEQNSLYAVEKATFTNTLKLLSDNQQFFADRKLFINCISDCLLNDDDFNELYITYGELFEKVVIEITENAQADSTNIETIKRRCKFVHSQLAIDDYGKGYSNSANLLKYTPDYIKIDRSLICDINNDLKKQQLVASVVAFCHDNQLLSLAEGVETSAEMKTVIRMGVDFIQGYYTSKPKPLFLDKISSDVFDEIIKTNLEARSIGSKKIYTARNDKEIDLVKLALEKYTDIQIQQSKLTINGDISKQVIMNISVMDNSSCELTLKNVNIASGNDKPTISLGEYSRLELNIIKKNFISESGIYVPQGSQLEIKGGGELIIDTCTPNGVTVGNDFEHPYGDIFINMSGSLSIIANGDNIVCIGGGFNYDDSEIKLISGALDIDLHARNGLAVGSFNGNSIIELSESFKANISIAGIKIGGIGSFCGSTEISSASEINITCSGAQAVGIGSVENGEGSINVSAGEIDVRMRSAKHSCIGTINGNISSHIRNCSVNINSEGDDAVGIGDSLANGSISVSDSNIDIIISAATPVDIASNDDSPAIHNCKIHSVINEKTVRDI